MWQLLIAVVLALAQASQPWVSQTLSQGGSVVSYMVTDPASGLSVAVLEPLPSTDIAAPDAKGQTLTTTIPDPNNPDEPWTVTTVRGTTESALDFLLRHRDMVDLVRKKLNGK